MFYAWSVCHIGAQQTNRVPWNNIYNFSEATRVVYWNEMVKLCWNRQFYSLNMSLHLQLFCLLLHGQLGSAIPCKVKRSCFACCNLTFLPALAGTRCTCQMVFCGAQISPCGCSKRWGASHYWTASVNCPLRIMCSDIYTCVTRACKQRYHLS